MLFADITIVNDRFEAEGHRWVAVEGPRIAGVFDHAPEGDFGEVYDGAGRILAPGFYNAHTHVPMTLLRGYAEGLPLQAWLNDLVWPFEAHIDDDAARPATLLAIAEMLSSGTVGFTDMYYQNDTRAQCVLETGIKANLSMGVIAFEPLPFDQMPAKGINEQLVRDYNGAGDGRLLIDACIHAEYTTNPLAVEGIGQQAADLGIGTHIHLSETRSEHEECKERHDGMTPARYFDSLGFFRAPCTAAHAVWTEPGDWELLAARGVSVASCPASNLKLGSGIAPVAGMLGAGVNVAVGTDGVASNNSHDMVKETYLLSLLQKGANGDPTLLGPADALRCATVNGARAQRRADCGLIREGFRADLVVFDATAPNMNPPTHPLNNLVYSASSGNVVLTMVDGAVLYRDGSFPTIDVERAIAETNAATRGIIAKVAAS